MKTLPEKVTKHQKNKQQKEFHLWHEIGFALFAQSLSHTDIQ